MQKWSQRSSPKNKIKKEFLATKQITALEHPAYSPDLTHDFFLFPKIKEILKGRHFDDIDDIRSSEALKAIPPNQFRNCFEEWTRRWHRCIASQWEYFEDDLVVFSSEVCSNFTAMSSRTLLRFYVYSECHLKLSSYILTGGSYKKFSANK